MNATVRRVTSQGGSHLRTIVAANLDRARAERDMTNRALGEKIGKTEHQVWRWRDGRHMPSLETLTALADVLFDGDVSRFYIDPEPEPNGEVAA